MFSGPRFRGPYRQRCARVFAHSVARTTARRLRHGPTLPSWNWTVEIGTAALRDQLHAAAALQDVVEQRKFLDGLILGPAPHQPTREERVSDRLRGTWHSHPGASDITMLYLHGGGFAVYPQEAHASFIGMLAEAVRASAFALDYRLAPEHPFPAALEDARTAYRWLLDKGIDPSHLVVAGDSAGGNLAIALLCDLRDRGLPQPALGIALSPATNLDRIHPSMAANQPFDWLLGEVATAWRDWYCTPEQRTNPLVSPAYANLTGLAPIHIQAGRSEILYDSIAAFADTAQQQKARVVLESWPEMNHVFQFFGHDAPQSRSALQRLREIVDHQIFHFGD